MDYTTISELLVRLQLHSVEQYEGFVPDLDYYLSTIVDYCSWGQRILEWSDEKLQAAKTQIAQSFFERHPEYNVLREMITHSQTPDLYAELSERESMRRILLEILSLLERAHLLS